MPDDNSLPPEVMRDVVLQLKHAYANLAFLNNKEEEFIRSMANGYATYGSKMQRSDKQLAFLASISNKLYYSWPSLSEEE